MQPRHLAVFPFIGLVFLTACGGDSGGSGSDSSTPINSTVFAEPWPADINGVYTAVHADLANDHDIAPGGAPPYTAAVNYAPVDVIGHSMGVDEGFLYIRFDFGGIIPLDKDPVPASGEIEAQTVRSQSISINFNSDGDLGTGAGGEGIDGIDIFFAFSLDYGHPPHIYTNYGFPDGDIHNHLGHAEGELGMGGPGYDHVVMRFRIADFSAYLPIGVSLDYGGWSEAESNLYHHFSFDPMLPGSFYIHP